MSQWHKFITPEGWVLLAAASTMCAFRRYGHDRAGSPGEIVRMLAQAAFSSTRLRRQVDHRSPPYSEPATCEMDVCVRVGFVMFL